MRLILAAALLVATPAFSATPVILKTPADAPSFDAEPPLPKPVRDMLEAAANTGNKAKIDVVVAIAKQTNKGHEAEIDRIVADVSAARQAELRDLQLASQRAVAAADIPPVGFFLGWKGRVQAGGSISTGNSDIRSVTLALNLQREGLKWRHRADGVLDFTDNRNGSDQERILTGYQIDYKFSERTYAWSRLEYERNRQAGIKRRFAESAGFGWRAIQGGPVRWDLEAGPALRQTKFEAYEENSIAGRGASRFAWKLSDATNFTSDTAIFFDSSATINTTAALTSKVFGSIGTRLSYNLAWEQDPPTGLKSLDTTTRVTLVYDF